MGEKVIHPDLFGVQRYDMRFRQGTERSYSADIFSSFLLKVANCPSQSPQR